MLKCIVDRSKLSDSLYLKANSNGYRAFASLVLVRASGFTFDPKRTLELNQQLERMKDQLPHAFCISPPGTILFENETIIQKYGLERYTNTKPSGRHVLMPLDRS